jgi:hypothetical protein
MYAMKIIIGVVIAVIICTLILLIPVFDKPREKRQTLLQDKTGTTITSDTSPTVVEENYPDKQLTKFLVNFDWNVPKLPKGFDWEEKVPTKQDLDNSGVFWDARYNKSDSNSSGEIPVWGGKLFEVSVDDKSPMYNKAGLSLSQELYSNFVDSGWDYSFRYGNWQISGMAAGAPLSEIAGYVKNNGSLVRTIVYSYNVLGGWQGPELGLKCPCAVNMSIFISEPVEMSEFITGLTKNGTE